MFWELQFFVYCGWYFANLHPNSWIYIYNFFRFDDSDDDEHYEDVKEEDEEDTKDPEEDEGEDMENNQSEDEADEADEADVKMEDDKEVRKRNCKNLKRLLEHRRNYKWLNLKEWNVRFTIVSDHVYNLLNWFYLRISLARKQYWNCQN